MAQYVYLIRLVKEDYTMPHTKAFLDREVADDHFQRDLTYYRKRGWDVFDDKDVCGVNVVRRASMIKKEDDTFDHATLLMDKLEIMYQ